MPLLIPQGISVRPAKEVIRGLQELLEKRRTLSVGRTNFLKEYKKLREELELTPEYARFHSEVCFRSGGICEREDCENPAEHVHHKVRISHAPHLALDPRLAEHICRDCHKGTDSSHRRWLK